jgi:AcrR family transcriptional regulator
MMPVMVAESAPKRARERARAELIAEITDTARAHLGEHGAAGLSLRAVSRDLGMASSALYRYFPSRDALLTTLIIDAYTALSDACDAAHAEVDPSDLLGRWRAIAHAVREWARGHPHDYALIYGSPVPGYAAPTDTIDPATRVAGLLMALLDDVEAAGGRDQRRGIPIPDGLAEQVDALRATAGINVGRARLLDGIGAWVLLFGMVNFELFGQFHNVFDDADELFAHQVDLMAERLGLDPSRPDPQNPTSQEPSP